MKPRKATCGVGNAGVPVDRRGSNVAGRGSTIPIPIPIAIAIPIAIPTPIWMKPRNPETLKPRNPETLKP